MFVVTHDIAFARESGERNAFVDEGTLGDVGAAAQVANAPREERTRQFLQRTLKQKEILMQHTFQFYDAHTCGNPIRIITAGVAPRLGHGLSAAAAASAMQQKCDWIRRALMREPRGHDMMAGAVLLPPSSDDVDATVVFMDTGGYLSMCGHGAIGLVTATVERGLVSPRTPGTMVLDVPAGRVELHFDQAGAKVSSVALRCVPSFLAAQGVRIDVPEVGPIVVDLAFGGNFCVIVEPQSGVPPVGDLDQQTIVRWGRRIRHAVEQAVETVHPLNPDLRGVAQVMFTGPARNPHARFMNAVFYGERSIDRSPCGSGSAARMAQLYATGRLALGGSFVHESIVGSLYDCRIVSTTRLGPMEAIVPVVRGHAYVLAEGNLFVDEDDEFHSGFIVN
jgi:4-hydroxyproline epimerase